MLFMDSAPPSLRAEKPSELACSTNPKRQLRLAAMWEVLCIDMVLLIHGMAWLRALPEILAAA
jgi:hypothetical protein